MFPCCLPKFEIGVIHICMSRIWLYPTVFGGRCISVCHLFETEADALKMLRSVNSRAICHEQVEQGLCRCPGSSVALLTALSSFFYWNWLPALDSIMCCRQELFVWWLVSVPFISNHLSLHESCHPTKAIIIICQNDVRLLVQISVMTKHFRFGHQSLYIEIMKVVPIDSLWKKKAPYLYALRFVTWTYQNGILQIP